MKKRHSLTEVAAGLAEYAPGGQVSLASSLDMPFYAANAWQAGLTKGHLILWICAYSFLVVSTRGFYARLCHGAPSAPGGLEYFEACGLMPMESLLQRLAQSVLFIS